MLTKENILNKISQEEIANTYLTLSGGEFAINNNSIKNPFKHDNSPGSFYLYYNNTDTLMMKDFANPVYNGDCFHMVGWYLKNTGRDNSFGSVLKEINNRFNLGLLVNSFNTSNLNVLNSHVPHNIDSKYLAENYYRMYGSEKKQIKFGFEVFSELTNDHLNYLDQYRITRKEAAFFKMAAVKSFYFGQVTRYRIWRSTKTDPIFRYEIPEYRELQDGSIEKTNNTYYQIYKPLTKLKKCKFKTNAKGSPLMGLEQAIINSEKVASYKPVLFITSSMKDVIILNKFKIAAVAPIGEGTNIPNFLLDYLETIFQTIVINYDNDEAGILATKSLKEKRPNYNRMCF
jgi:hypothetical protein